MRLVGLQEIASHYGFTRQRAFRLAAKKGFPAPAAHLSQGRVWREKLVAEWFDRRGRPWSPTDEPDDEPDEPDPTFGSYDTWDSG